MLNKTLIFIIGLYCSIIFSVENLNLKNSKLMKVEVGSLLTDAKRIIGEASVVNNEKFQSMEYEVLEYSDEKNRLVDF